MTKRHNKKRNTVFLFEVLVRELTKSIVDRNLKRSDTIKEILKAHFNANSALGTELDCFKSLCETSELDLYTAEKLIFTAKRAHQAISSKQIFNEQSSVIKKINSNLGAEVYNNFVPNYRAYATVAQLFNDKVAVKTRVLLEKKLLEQLTASVQKKDEVKPVDELVIKTFSERFNEKYANLHEEQKMLLNKYMTSLDEAQTDFKVYLVSEMRRIRSLVKESFNLQEVADDEEMVESTKKVLEYIDNVKINNVNETDILKVLKLQTLVREYKEDANKNQDTL